MARTALSAAQAKAAVLDGLAAGLTVADACKAASRTTKSHENWRSSDADYAAKVDQIRDQRKGAKNRGVEDDASTLNFTDWRKRFLNQDTFPHQEAWIRLIETGEYEPREGEFYQPSDPNRIIINVPPFHAKALKLDTIVPTPNGRRTIGDLRVGDEVFGLDGKPTRVTAKSPVFTKPCFEVRVNSGETFTACEDHLWETRATDTRTETLTTRQLFERGGQFKLPAHDALHGEDVDYILDPYLLGVWLGDGSTSDGQITSADPEVIEAFAHEGFTTVRYEIKNKGHASQYNILGLFPILSELGIRGRKRVPPGYLLGSYEQRLALLQGLMDTDGTCSPAGQASFTNKNEDLARGVLYLASSLGLRPGIREGRAMLNGVDCGPKWMVYFTPGSIPVFRLERKLRRQTIEAKRRGGNLRRIVSVTPVETVETQCITVDNDSHVFLIGDSLIPTHNSQTLTIEYLTYRICMDPNIRIIIVSKKQDQAKKFLYSIKQRLTSNQWSALQAAYAPEGGFKPERSEGAAWGADKIYVAGIDSGEKDPTVEAIGIGGQIYGSRADIIIMDDCIVGSNASEYDKQINWLESEVENRVRDGKIIIIGTRLATVDLYSELANGERYLSGRTPWTILRQPAVLEYADNPAAWKTLWPASTSPMETGQKPRPDGMYDAWDGPRMAKERDKKPPRVWSLVYMQADVSDDAVFDPKCVMGSVDKRRKPGPLRAGAWGHPRHGLEGQYVIASMDPAMTGDTFTLVGTVDRKDSRRRIMQAWVQSSPTPQYIRDLVKQVTDEYAVNEWVIEQNAFQLFLTHDEELQAYTRQRGVKITGHYTGRNKQDPDFGVASLAPLFGGLKRIHEGSGRADHDGNNTIELPDPDVSHGVKALIEELIAWQPGKSGKQLRMDGPMALWFFELRAREILGVARRRTSQFMANPYLSRGDQAKRMVVNLSEFRALAE